MSIFAAKQIPSGVLVKCTGVVTASFFNYFYMESENRSCGIRVSNAGYTATVGNKATVVGYASVLSTGERIISAEDIPQDDPDTALAPVFLTTKNVGGGDLGGASVQRGQYGVQSGTGLNNVGLLVRVTGEFVGPVTPTYFFLDDGSGVSCKIIDNGAFMEAGEGQNVAITGVVSLDKDVDGHFQRSILFTDGQVVE